MDLVVLIVHLILCVGLIGLVLLQRSEGGALGMGGGGGGSLMSGRGAADALAKLTSVAGGLFLVTSLSLTALSGPARSSEGNWLSDMWSTFESDQDETTPPVDQQTQTSAPSLAASETEAASEPSGPVIIAPAPDQASARAGPVQAGAATQETTPQTNVAARETQRPAQTQTQSAARTPPPATTPARTETIAAQPPAREPPPTQTATNTAPRTNPQLTAPVTLDPATAGSQTGESGNDAQPLEVVRRERAGPTQ